MSTKTSFGENLKDYFSLQVFSIRVFRIAFAAVGFWYLFDYLPVVWQLTKAGGLFNLEQSGANYSDAIPGFMLILTPEVFVILSAILLTSGLLLILFNRHPRMGFTLAATALYLTSFRIRPLIFGGNNTLVWAAVIGATLPRISGSDSNFKRIFSLSTLAVHLQIFSIYFQSGFHKVGPGWTSTFTATEAALRNPHYLNDAGIWLAGFPVLSKVLTFAVMFLELPFALLMIFGFTLRKVAWPKFVSNVNVKVAFAICAISFHLGTAVFLNLRFFPYASIAFALLLFSLPEGEKKQTVEPFVARSDKKTLVLQLSIIIVIAAGLLNVQLSRWIPSQRFRYFSPTPDTKFVDIEIESRMPGSQTATRHLPLHSDDIEIPDFYKKRIQWAISRFMIKSDTWVEFYCNRLKLTDDKQLIRIQYRWSNFDERNAKMLNEQQFIHDYPCKRNETLSKKEAATL